MIKDVLLSFKDNFKEKTTNPFLGLYISMLFIRNWELVYSLFNFNKSMGLDEKLKYIHHYFVNGNGYVIELFLNILWAFGVLIVTYTLVNISRFIVNLFEKRLTPLIYKITDSKSIVLKSSYELLRAERDSLQNRLESEREQKSRLEIQIKKHEDRIDNLLSENIKATQDNYENLDDLINSENEKGNISSGDITRLKHKLLEDKYVDKFIKYALLLKSGSSLREIAENKDDIMYFIRLNLLRYSSTDANGNKYFNLTEDGKKVFDISRFD